jgi:predicted phage-related endonuclease
MALTEEQKAFRRKVIGGSDANIIMGEDSERILRLWQLKRGEIQDEDLSDVLPVQMGVFTEPFNIEWFQKQTGRLVTDQGVQKLHATKTYMGCTLDGLTDNGETIFEAKHVSAFSNADEIQYRYMPQLYHNMIVCGVERAVLSVFYGNHKWESYNIQKDVIYAMIVENAVDKFWASVQSGEPPVTISAAKPVDAVRRVDMTGNNRWADLAKQYKDNVTGKKLCDDAVSGLKELVDEDVAEAFGYGIKFKRDKRGSLRISEF